MARSALFTAEGSLLRIPLDRQSEEREKSREEREKQRDGEQRQRKERERRKRREKEKHREREITKGRRERLKREILRSIRSKKETDIL